MQTLGARVPWFLTACPPSACRCSCCGAREEGIHVVSLFVSVYLHERSLRYLPSSRHRRKGTEGHALNPQTRDASMRWAASGSCSLTERRPVAEAGPRRPPPTPWAHRPPTLTRPRPSASCYREDRRPMERHRSVCPGGGQVTAEALQTRLAVAPLQVAA